MRILVIGVSGFIGRHLYHVLSQNGHRVTGCSREKVPDVRWQALDFLQSQSDWEKQLQKQDIVINAVGVYQESPNQSFSKIHEIAPKRLFGACEKLGLKVLQISALGAEKAKPETAFLQTKRGADQYLLKTNAVSVILYPGIVLGERGRSTSQFMNLADLPCIPLVFGRDRQLPLISIHQLSDYILGVIDDWPAQQHAAVLLAKPETMEYLLNNLCQWRGLKKGCFFPISQKLLSLWFSVFPRFSFGAFNRQSIELLSQYNPEDYLPVTEQSASDSLVKRSISAAFREQLIRRKLFYLSLFVLSLIWFVSGLSSLVNFAQSRELIMPLGIKPIWSDSLITIAAVINILVAVFIWIPGIRRNVIYFQLLVMVTYTLIITLFTPFFWLHPFAPVVKNLAVFVMSLYLLNEEKGVKHV